MSNRLVNSKSEQQSNPTHGQDGVVLPVAGHAVEAAGDLAMLAAPMRIGLRDGQRRMSGREADAIDGQNALPWKTVTAGSWLLAGP